MKLLFDCTELSYFDEESGHRAGVFYVALNLLNELKRQGVDITFISDFRRYYFMKNIKEFSNIPLLPERSFVNRIIAWVLYITRKFPYTLRYALIVLARFYDKYLYRINKKNLEQLEGFDVYFSPFTPPSKEVEMAKLKRFRMIHDVIPIVEKGLSKNTKDWHNKVYNSINGHDYYVTNSEYTRTDVLNYFPCIREDNIKTTLLGVNESFAPKAAAANFKYVFSLCAMGKRKNVIFGIKNFFKFIEKNNITDLKLVLGGSTWRRFESTLNEELKHIDRSKIVLTGYIKDEDLPGYYSNALMFIYPSLYEGFGLPVLEAMKCGCPVIASNRSSIPEVLGDCGILVDPELDEEMLAAFEKMYYDADFRCKCIENGLKRASEFTWERCVSELLEFIKEKSV